MKSELTLKYIDGCCKGTYTYQRMKELSDEAERLEKQLERVRLIDATLRRWLQDREEMTDEQFCCYTAWCKHSDLSPDEIMNKYVFPKD